MDGSDDAPFVYVRGKQYQRDVPEVTPVPQSISPSGSRWTRSAVTFGPLGRLSVTTVCITPLVLMAVPMIIPGWSMASHVFVFLLAIGTAPLALWVLRDIWRRSA